MRQNLSNQRCWLMLVDGGCNQDQPRPTSMGVMMLVGYTFRLTTITTIIVERQTKTHIKRTRATKTSKKQKRIYEETRSNTRRHRSGLPVVFWVGTPADLAVQYGKKRPGFLRESQCVQSFQKSQIGCSAMRIPENCKLCGGPSITYATVTGSAFRTHYRKCRSCSATSKGISASGGMPGKPVLTTSQASTTLQTFNSHSLER